MYLFYCKSSDANALPQANTCTLFHKRTPMQKTNCDQLRNAISQYGFLCDNCEQLAKDFQDKLGKDPTDVRKHFN